VGGVGSGMEVAESRSDWPYCLRPTPEEVRRDEEFIQKYENNEIELEFRPLSEKQLARVRRLQAQPYCISTIIGDGEAFTIEMRCDCGADGSFDQTATRPYIQHRNSFIEAHRNCQPSRPHARRNHES